MYDFTLGNAVLQALPSGALYWPDQRLLCVSDLHFGKSERLARRGGALLPPYETRATLDRLDRDIETIGARQVVCLGDSFDDLAAADSLDRDDQTWLTRLMAGRVWTWIEGNHDAGPTALGGSHLETLAVKGLTFRHIASPQTATVSAEISGHYHPKARLAGKSYRCFLIDAHRVILPAYGAYTGGLWADDPVLTQLMTPNTIAVLTGKTAIAMPMRQRMS